MRPILSTLLAGLAATTLAACGGSSSGGGGAGGGGYADLSYEDRTARLRSELDLGAGAPMLTPERKLPGGSARYDGVAALNLTDRDDLPDDPADLRPGDIEGYLGALTVNVNFADDTLSGRITDFEDLNRRSRSGELRIRDGRLTGDNRQGIGTGLEAVARGSVAGTRLVMDVSGSFLGERGKGLALYMVDRNDEGIGNGLAAR